MVRWDGTGTMLASCSDDGTAKVHACCTDVLSGSSAGNCWEFGSRCTVFIVMGNDEHSAKSQEGMS